MLRGSNYSSLPTIPAILSKLVSVDPDIRYMALSDLAVLLKHPDTFANTDHSISISSKVIDCLEDINGEVQNQAVLALPLFISKYTDQADTVFKSLISLLRKPNGATRDVATTALKSIISQATSNKITRLIAVILIPELIQINIEYKTSRDKAESEEAAREITIPQESLDILLECIDHFSSIGINISNVEIQEQITEIALWYLKSDMGGLRKKSITLITSLSSQLQNKFLNTVFYSIINKFTSPSVIDITGQDSSSLELEIMKSYITLLKSLIKTVPSKMGDAIMQLVPQLLSIVITGKTIPVTLSSDSSTPMISQSDISHKLINQRDENLNNVDDDLRELILNTFTVILDSEDIEITVLSSSDRKRTERSLVSLLEDYLSTIKAVALRFLRFDPNYTYGFGDDSVEDFDKDIDEESTEDIDGDHQDEYDEDNDDEIFFESDDEDYADLDFSDDDEISWKVRRASARLLYTFMLYPTCSFDVVLDELLPYFISRLVEREENVRVEIMSLLILVIKLCKYKTDTDLIVGDESNLDVEESESSPKKVRLSTSDLNISSYQSRLLKSIPTLYISISKFLTSPISIDRISAIELLKEIVCTLDGALSSYLGAVIPLCFNELSSTKVSRTIAGSLKFLKSELLSFLEAIILHHTYIDISDHITQILKCVVLVINSGVYKVTEQAINVARILITKIDVKLSLPEQLEEVNNLLQSSLNIMNSDEDNEVKDKALQLIGQIMCKSNLLYPDNSLLVKSKVLNELISRFSNEVFCISASRIFIDIFNSPVCHSITSCIPSIVRISVDYLKKNIRQLRILILELLKIIFTKEEDSFKLLVSESIPDDPTSWFGLLFAALSNLILSDDIELQNTLATIIALLERIISDRTLDLQLNDQCPTKISMECDIILNHLFESNGQETPILNIFNNIIKVDILGDGLKYEIPSLYIKRLFNVLITVNPDYLLETLFDHFFILVQTRVRSSSIASLSNDDNSSSMINKKSNINVLSTLSGLLLSSGLDIEDSLKEAYDKTICRIEKSISSTKELSKIEADNTVNDNASNPNKHSLLIWYIYTLGIAFSTSNKISNPVIDKYVVPFSEDLINKCKQSSKFQSSTIECISKVLGRLSLKIPSSCLNKVFSELIESLKTAENIDTLISFFNIFIKSLNYRHNNIELGNFIEKISFNSLYQQSKFIEYDTFITEPTNILNLWQLLLKALENDELFTIGLDKQVSSTENEEVEEVEEVDTLPKQFSINESLKGKSLRHSIAKFVGTFLALYPDMFSSDNDNKYLLFSRFSGVRARAISAEATIYINQYQEKKINHVADSTFEYVWKELLILLADSNIIVQLEALHSIANIIHNESPILYRKLGIINDEKLSSILDKALPLSKNKIKNEFYISAVIGIIEQYVCIPKPELLTVVHMGPFKNEIDHGLNQRKLVYDILYLISNQPTLLSIMSFVHLYENNELHIKSNEAMKTVLERYILLLKIGEGIEKNSDIKRISKLTKLKLRSIFLNDREFHVYIKYLLLKHYNKRLSESNDDDIRELTLDFNKYESNVLNNIILPLKTRNISMELKNKLGGINSTSTNYNLNSIYNIGATLSVGDKSNPLYPSGPVTSTPSSSNVDINNESNKDDHSQNHINNILLSSKFINHEYYSVMKLIEEQLTIEES